MQASASEIPSAYGASAETSKYLTVTGSGLSSDEPEELFENLTVIIDLKEADALYKNGVV